MPECQNTRNRDTKRRGDDDQECEVREEKGLRRLWLEFYQCRNK